ncbi:MAG TPA: hypothetical protein P5335_09690 [Flavobacterium sp.]|nr:hypothetical protein [Flavobacterium sp.]HRZ75192.1 hypothetical protein [Flavobacterium sp.]
MKYSEHYNQHYDKIYSLVEFKIKKYFIDCKSKKLNYGICYNDLLVIINKYLKNRISEKNTDIKALHTIFNNRLLRYSEDEIDLIIENDILIEFQKLNNIELPKTNSIYKLINEFALRDVLKEITRLLQNNSRLFQLFYELNEFDQFEIKYYRLQRLDDTEIFINLNKRKNPHLYTEPNTTFFNNETANELSLKNPSLPLAITILNEIGFFELEKLKSFTDNQLSQLIAIIQIKDPNNKNELRSIGGNIRMVKGSNDNPSRYTAGSNKNESLAKSLLTEIKLGL